MSIPENPYEQKIYHTGVECKDGAEWWLREIQRQMFVARGWSDPTTTKMQDGVLIIREGNGTTYRLTCEEVQP